MIIILSFFDVTSINNKLDALVIELNSNNVDVAFITETWWTDTSLKVIKGYSTFYKNSEIGKGSGVFSSIITQLKLLRLMMRYLRE